MKKYRTSEDSTLMGDTCSHQACEETRVETLMSLVSQTWPEGGADREIVDREWYPTGGKFGTLTLILSQLRSPDPETLFMEWDWPRACEYCSCYDEDEEGTPFITDYRVFRVEQVTESAAKRIVSLVGAL